MKMEKGDEGRVTQLFKSLGGLMRKCIFRILSVGAIPNHIAFILDGNRRYAKKKKLTIEGAGHRTGFFSLMYMLKYCTELGVKYITFYAFSIDNFKRTPMEVQFIMDLMLEKIELLLKEGHIHNHYGMRLIFIGNLKLLSEPLRVAAKKAMIATANNTKIITMICVAYSSRNEIIHAVQESCKHKLNDKSQSLRAGSAYNVENKGVVEYERMKDKRPVKLVDVEQHMYMAVAPDPDIVIRTSGEKRLSNFLIWQTCNCLLYSPAVLWPEINLQHLVWAILNFQRYYSHLEKKKKKQL